jgi:signal transduction histidine kinase
MVLKNLVTNAVKFTEKGRVTIVASPCGEGVEFTVTDTGIGIAPKHLGLIFEPFQQVSTSRNRPYGGAGLGLYIVRQLCQLLGGKVTVESEVGQGSRFCVWIPQSFPSLVIPTT